MDYYSIIFSSNDEYLEHYGVGADDDPPGRGSGRYPKGSGENPYQHEDLTSLSEAVSKYKKQGMTQSEIATALGYKNVSDMRSAITLEKEKREADRYLKCQQLHEQGMSNVDIAKQLGVSEGTVRNYLAGRHKQVTRKTSNVAEMLKAEVDAKGYIDISTGVETELGLSKERLKAARLQLEAEGYQLYSVKIEQANGHYTYVNVLGRPDSTYKEVKSDPTLIKPIQSYTPDGGETIISLRPPVPINPDRVYVRFTDDEGKGGKERDGIIQLRRGVEDLSLGDSRYAQVRIAVDLDKDGESDHYMKGMAIYAEDDQIPEGYDVIYNYKKGSNTPLEKVYKEVERNSDGTPNQENLFGASIKANGQSNYISSTDGQEHQSLINKLNEQGDWESWSSTVSSQVLSKQPTDLVKKQLRLTYEDKLAEYNEIISLTNPTVQKYFLEGFADECDSAASQLKAKAFSGQSTAVVISCPTLAENEVYAPRYEHGEWVALIRHPHAGPQEIAKCRVNNKNPEGINAIGNDSADAIGLHPRSLEKLSGADSDGDNVLVIPLANTPLLIKPELKGLVGFDPDIYKWPEGVKHTKMTKKMRGIQMGKATNLITDMQLYGCDEDELTRAVKFSMVVVDAYKHDYNYIQAEKDLRIQELKEKYQWKGEGKRPGGATTIISKASKDVEIDERKPISYVDPETGKKTYGVDPNTGKRMWGPSGNTTPYYIPSPEEEKLRKQAKKTGEPLVIPEGTPKGTWEYRNKKESVPMMELVDDAMDLVSARRHPTELAYAEFANQMKQLARDARKRMVTLPNSSKDPQAAVEYASEVKSLGEKVMLADKNAPRERQANIIAVARVKALVAANPELKQDADKLKKIKGQCIRVARESVGAHKPRIAPTAREEEALRNNAISHSKLLAILNNMEDSDVKRLFTPKQNRGQMTDSMKNLAKSMSSCGYTLKEIADRLGVSPSTVSKVVSGKEE